MTETWPIAYHITVGTYGTRLTGDSRGTVIREQNTFGTPFFPPNCIVERVARGMLKYPPVYLSDAQRERVESQASAVCKRGGWVFHTVAAQQDHVHLLVTAQVDGKRVRAWWKRWLGEELSEVWPTEPGQTWWAEGGSVKWCWDEAYFYAVKNYILRQRFSPE